MQRQTQRFKAEFYLGRVFRGAWLKFSQGESFSIAHSCAEPPFPLRPGYSRRVRLGLQKAGGERLLQEHSKRK